MRLAIVNLTGGGMSGGYRKYLQELLPRLVRTPPVEALINFLPPLDRPLPLPPEIETRSWPATATNPQRWMSRSLDEFGADVVFIPTARSLECGRPTVCMIRNMEPLQIPFGGNRLAESLRNVVRARVARRAVNRADGVIAVSQYVKQFLTRRWHVAEEKIGVVPHGVEARAQPTRPAQLPEVIDGGFLFTAGSIRPARGLEDVVTALALLNGRGIRLRLVIGGAADAATTHYESEMHRMARKLGVDAQITWAGYLTGDAMAWCFDRAAMFVMTSRAEACPNIVLEAMAEGALSVSTDQEPMPEFYVDTAVYYDRGNARALASQIESMISMRPEERLRLRRQARERARQFTWEATAIATAREIGRIADSSRGQRVGIRLSHDSIGF